MWQDIKAWVKAKGGVAHVIVMAGLFLDAAYNLNPQFKQSVQHLYSVAPSWVEQAVGIGVSLFAFYKTWGSSQQAPPPPNPPAA
jgi:hypothetical protein